MHRRGRRLARPIPLVDRTRFSATRPIHPGALRNPSDRARWHVLLGDLDAGFRDLDQAVEERTVWLPFAMQSTTNKYTTFRVLVWSALVRPGPMSTTSVQNASLVESCLGASLWPR